MRMKCAWMIAMTVAGLCLLVPAAHADFVFSNTDIASDMTDWSVGYDWFYAGAGTPIEYTSPSGMMGGYVLTTYYEDCIEGSGWVWTIDDPQAGGGQIGSWADFTVTEDTVATFDLDLVVFPGAEPYAAQFRGSDGTSRYIYDGDVISLFTGTSYGLYVAVDIASYDSLVPLRAEYDFTFSIPGDTPAPVPEPATMLLLALGTGCIALRKKVLGCA